MQKEEFDFAIFGSEIDAAILAVELINSFDARVLLIRDQVNDYGLHLHPSFSMGAVSDVNTLNELALAVEKWQSLFSGREGSACYERECLRIRVASAANNAALHYIENALIDVQMPCERKADRDGFEDIYLRDVITPKRRQTLEFLVGKFAPAQQLMVCDRSDFIKITHLKNGQLSLQRDGVRISAAKSIFTDDDLAIQMADHNIKKQIVRYSTNGYQFSRDQKANHTNMIVADLMGVMFQHSKDSVQIAIPSNLIDQKKAFSINSEAKLKARATKESICTRDGAPLLACIAHQNNWIFVADKTIAPFLAMSAAHAIAGTTISRFWGALEAKNRKCAEVTAIALQNTGDQRANA